MLYTKTRFIGEARKIVKAITRTGKRASYRAEKINGLKTYLIFIY